MAFVRKITQTPNITEHFRGGRGHIESFPILSEEEMRGAGRVCAMMTLQPGCEVGLHQHVNDWEVFHFLSGSGIYTMGDEQVRVSAGDVAFVDDGEAHALYNDSDEPMQYLALVLYTKKD